MDGRGIGRWRRLLSIAADQELSQASSHAQLYKWGTELEPLLNFVLATPNHKVYFYYFYTNLLVHHTIIIHTLDRPSEVRWCAKHLVYRIITPVFFSIF